MHCAPAHGGGETWEVENIIYLQSYDNELKNWGNRGEGGMNDIMHTRTRTHTHTRTN